ncbi:hydroxypyruvate isomerase family protein [Pontivivens insulae]|uniref:Hydroxypyruvate isomerase n=1 Tax=Pontivivens insulae TaxID=1639689 RepID=A0A2R8A7U0_9RHOB|nr:TIM barrel protein [Pontivivens insulae]RED18384.1 hydroxypyruvate isomerase [Pontivivens insulae]SPF28282.1 Hydroxypyruvate isomerase [Pontivivens insulae]
MKFSANLGFLWTELPLPEAIHAAANAGFAAVECHWPYATLADDVRAALGATGLRMLGLNTSRGDVAAGENGVCALPDHVEQARASIDQALTYAAATGTRAVHIMAGFAAGPNARGTFIENLTYACDNAGDHLILIEPLNHFDAPGYFLSTTEQAEAIIAEVGHPNLRLMFDCYHVQIMEGDVSRRLARLLPIIGHIQIAGAPSRGRPDQGELNYSFIFEELTRHGYDLPLGAEYRPEGGDTCASLGWMDTLWSAPAG